MVRIVSPILDLVLFQLDALFLIMHGVLLNSGACGYVSLIVTPKHSQANSYNRYGMCAIVFSFCIISLGHWQIGDDRGVLAEDRPTGI